MKYRLVLIDESEDVSQEVTVDSGILDQMREFLRKIIHREFIVFVELEQKVAESLFPSKTVTDERRDLERRKDVFEEIDELEESDVVYFEPDQVGKHTYEFPDNITRRVTEEVDAVVLLGFSKILRGRIITEPEHGVLSFHGADIRKYRGRPGAFFQFINREEEIGLTLQQLTEDLDGERIVHFEHTDISDVKSWKETRYRVELLYGSMLVEGLRKLEDSSFTPEEPDPPGELTYSSEGSELPNVYRCLKLTIKKRYF